MAEDTTRKPTPAGRPDPTAASDPGGQGGGGGQLPGDERLDMERTPGDGSLQGSTPAGLTVEELRKRAEEEDGSAQPGTG